ncbi:alpha/beta fold hydrolase [Streptomyces parvus]|uniref:alpha/beta fold hydrolase n=1 Tax=Streptomyces parvus TaxID=66428 RepID=UPI002100886F|nr:alpha/beta fold hydrolase [Streptomyces parvus]MCQ1580422.1 alpha/beta hydrolase [Streptomyces parvus]
MPAEPLHLPRPDGARLAVYRREPSATPDVTLTLAHGWSASAAVWDDVIRHLPADDRMRILTFDQRGHGASTPGRTPAGIGVLADDLQAVLSAFSAGTPAIVAAHSMGSMAVLMGAARDSLSTPVELAGLLLVSASSGQIDLRLEGYPPLARVVGSARTAIAEACTRAPRSTRYLRDLLSPSAAPRPATDVAAAWFRAILDFDVAGRLAALEDTPVHLVTGAQDRVIPPIHTCRLAAELPHARVHVIEGATHRVPIEQPALLASLLQDLVERTRVQQHAPSRDADGILRAAAHLLFTKRGTLGRGGRLTRIETWSARRADAPTRVERDALIDTRQ